jgi:hypothetical protein
MGRSARNVPQHALALILAAAACGGGKPAARWYAIEVHGVPVGAEGWIDLGGGAWERRLELDYLAGGDHRRARVVERCTGHLGSWRCPGGAIEAPGTGSEQRVAVAARPSGPARDVLPSLVLPAAVPSPTPGRVVYRVGGEAREVVAADRLEIPAVDRARLAGWVARARRSPVEARAGDLVAGGACVRQARALVALAGAEGIPAWLVTGRLLREGPAGSGLYPHAWAEVTLSGRTWSVDPALGQVPTDALHVALARGDEAPRLDLSVSVVGSPRVLDPPGIRD